MTDAYTPQYDTLGVLVVDMTRSLADPSVEGSYEVGVEAAAEIEDFVTVARDAEIPVFFSRGGKLYHTNADSDLTDVERNSWPLTNPIKQWDDEQSRAQFEILPSLAPDESVVVTKRAPSAFFGTMLHTYLAALGVRKLVVCGMTTSGCVRATVVDAFSHNYRVVIPQECVADPRPELHERTLEDLDGRYAFVRRVDAVREELLDA